MGLCIVILVIALIGATGYIGYDIGHSDGYSTGYYSGKQACITEYQNRIDFLNQQISEQEAKIQQYENKLMICEQDLSKYIQAYTGSQKENTELRNVIEELSTEIEKLRIEQPTSDFGDIDDLIELALWLLF